MTHRSRCANESHSGHTQIPEALDQLRCRFPQSEAVVLSTCNRTEVYAAAENPDDLPGHADLVEFLADYHGLDYPALDDDVFQFSDEEVVRHLFKVAASLDSLVIGEAQILGQVKAAYEMAISGDSAGP